MAATPTNIPDITTNPFASAQMGLNYGPQTQNALRHSQYLADALRQMSEASARPVYGGLGEVASRVLATAILQHQNDRAQDALVQAMQGDRQGQISQAVAGTPLQGQFQGAPAPEAAPAPQGSFMSRLGHAIFGGSNAAPTGPTAPPAAAPASDQMPTAPPPPQPALAAAIAQPPAAPATDQTASAAPAPGAASLSDPKIRLLSQLVWNEARGEPAAGQQAVAAVALNRARESGLPLDQVAFAPHQFSGFTPQRAASIPDAELQRILPNISPALAGQDPTGGADHFFNPQLANPSWGQGEGQMIGQHKFMHLGYGGGQAQGVPPPPPPPDPNGPDVQTVQGYGGGQPAAPQQAAASPAPNAPGQAPLTGAALGPQVPPYQVAANGPTPPPPSGAQPPVQTPVQTPAQSGPQIASPPQAVAQAQALAATIPHQLVANEEWQHAGELIRNWRTYDAGMAYLEKLKERAASPVEMKPGTYWGQDGQPHAVEQFQDVPGAPNAYVQRSNLDNSVHVQGNPAYGSLAAGTHMNNQGAVSPVPVQQAPRYRIKGTLGWWSDGPDGRPVKVADDAITPKDLQTARDSWRNSDEAKKASEAIAAYNGLIGAVGKMSGNNGVISTAAIDSYLRGINPGMGAKNTTVTMFLDHLGLPTEIKSWVQSNVPGGGGGYLTPQTFNQMISTIQAYANAHANIANGMAANDLKAFNGYGVPVTPDMLGESLTPLAPMPKVQWLNEQPPPAAAQPPPGQPSYAQVQAEIARRKANGTWKGR